MAGTGEALKLFMKKYGAKGLDLAKEGAKKGAEVVKANPKASGVAALAGAGGVAAGRASKDGPEDLDFFEMLEELKKKKRHEAQESSEEEGYEHE